MGIVTVSFGRNSKSENWRRDWDSFSSIVLGAHRLAPVATHALFIHRAATVLRSRPPSLAFVRLTFLPQEAFGLASSPTFFSLCLFSHDIRYTKLWRRDWDSNPDGLAPFTGFQDRLLANSDTPPTMFSLSTPPPSYKDGVLPG